MSFIDYLIQEKVLTLEEGENLRDEGEESENRILDALQKKGLEHDATMKLRSEYFNIPFRRVNVKEVPAEVLKNIPEESALHYRFAPIGLKNGVLEVGIVDPENIEARDALQFIASRLQLPFKIFLITEADFQALLENYKGLSGEVHKALGQLESELAKVDTVAPSWRAVREQKEETKLVEDTPVTKIVAVILRHSTEGNASDVHIEHTGENVRVRFRVDGVLYTSIFLPVAIHSAVVARIKVLAKLRLDEKRKPQDGSFSATIDKRLVDFRVSTFPAYFGEKIVLRILDPSKGVKTLEETGLSPEHIAVIRKALTQPYGLILLTGPTGSGKTTTLYAMLNEVDKESFNVVSLEDPIEYSIPGMSQSQVRPEIGYTFASGLRHILRQDPDIIMVGEIRDKETAHLAIHAALTGHLVFSTLHTNNAAGVVPRLIDMGVDPFLIAPTLNLAVAQRLAKVICPSSKKAVPIEGAVRAMVLNTIQTLPPESKTDFMKYAEVYEAMPSSECPGGTHGRTGVFEVLEVNKDMERVILENPVEVEIMRAARKNGMLTMREDALLKSFKGVIPFQEVSEFE